MPASRTYSSPPPCCDGWTLIATIISILPSVPLSTAPRGEWAIPPFAPVTVIPRIPGLRSAPPHDAAPATRCLSAPFGESGRGCGPRRSRNRRLGHRRDLIGEPPEHLPCREKDMGSPRDDDSHHHRRVAADRAHANPHLRSPAALVVLPVATHGVPSFRPVASVPRRESTPAGDSGTPSNGQAPDAHGTGANINGSRPPAVRGKTRRFRGGIPCGFATGFFPSRSVGATGSGCYRSPSACRSPASRAKRTTSRRVCNPSLVLARAM